MVELEHRGPLVHVLEADPQVVPAGHQRQDRRGPQAGQPDEVDPLVARLPQSRAANGMAAPSTAPPRISAPSDDELEGRLPLGERG